MYEAGDAGRWDIVLWAVQHGCLLHPLALEYACHAGQVEVLQASYNMVSNGEELRAYAASVAAINHQWELLRWGYQGKADFNGGDILKVARAGNLEVLKWLYHNGCPLHSQLCEEAGTCVVMVWALKHGVPMGAAKEKNPAVWQEYRALRRTQEAMRMCCAKANYLVARGREVDECVTHIAALPKEFVLDIVQQLDTIWPQR